ncbi:hypothetical protein QP166_01170 [Sphingomonas sp. LR60]|uniref:hypothetical protein n=1 Tax=Sphingomonas sp. LR60 TaxID=3050233 RepID=UPI002FDFCC4A
MGANYRPATVTIFARSNLVPLTPQKATRFIDVAERFVTPSRTLVSFGCATNLFIQSNRHKLCQSVRHGVGWTTMIRMVRKKKLRSELAAAQRASAMITDPLSMQMLIDYIAELEDQLYRGDTNFVHAAPLSSQSSSSTR